MSEPLRAIRPVIASERCEGCREKDHEIAKLNAQIERLTHAVQRDADFYDVRAVHDARSYIERADGGFLERSRRKNSK